MTQRAGEQENTARLRVVLVDDSTLFRQGLRRALEDLGVEVIGEASNGASGAKLVGELRPDVTVMDLQMPQMDGTAATRAVLANDPLAKVLICSVSIDEAGVVDALASGACGYLLKDTEAHDVVSALKAAVAGESTISPRVATQLIARLRAGSDAAPATDDLSALTSRELEILRLVTTGLDNSQIAQLLFLSPATVKNHVAHILDKLGVDNRVQAAVRAVRAGLL